MIPTDKRSGFTLMELTVTMLIVAALAALVLPMASSFLNNSLNDAQVTTTRASMTNLRNALTQYQQDMKGIQVWTTTVPQERHDDRHQRFDMQWTRTVPGMVGSAPGTTGVPLTLKDLLIQPYDATGVNLVPSFNPATRKGWRGP